MPLDTFNKVMPHNTLLCGPNIHLVLLFLVVPGHLVFNLAIGLSQGFTALSSVFLLLYLSAALLQVGLLLHLANVMVHNMWARAVDPDNSAIPYLTALGDLLGGAALALVFNLMEVVH